MVRPIVCEHGITPKGRCPACKRAADAAYRDRNRDRIREMDRLWRDANRETKRAGDRRYRAENPERRRESDRLAGAAYKARHPDRYRELNKERTRRWRALNPERDRESGRASNRRYYESHGERVRAAVLAYARSHPETVNRSSQRRRARLASADVRTISARDARTLVPGNPCAYCGRPSAHVDHVVPLARGGRHAIGNLVPACGRCNQRKGERLIVEFRVYLAAAE